MGHFVDLNELQTNSQQIQLHTEQNQNLLSKYINETVPGPHRHIIMSFSYVLFSGCVYFFFLIEKHSNHEETETENLLTAKSLIF